jgi:hypothetical protein
VPGAGIPGKFITGRYYGPIGARTGAVRPAGTLYAVPFIVAEVATFDRIAINVATAGAGSTCRLGIYSDTGNSPAALVLDAGGLDSGLGGTQLITIAQTLQPAVYWLALVSTGGTDPNVTGVAAGGLNLGAFTASATINSTIAACYTRTGVSAGALPDPFAPTATAGNGALVILRAA